MVQMSDEPDLLIGQVSAWNDGRNHFEMTARNLRVHFRMERDFLTFEQKPFELPARSLGKAEPEGRGPAIELQGVDVVPGDEGWKVVEMIAPVRENAFGSPL